MNNLFFILFLFLPIFSLAGETAIGTWNMKWMSGTKPVRDVKNVKFFIEHIEEMEVDLIAIQEIVPSYLSNEIVYSFYLDLIVKGLNNKPGVDWIYVLSKQKINQRVGFLWNKNKWELEEKTWYTNPGASFRSKRYPFVGHFKHKISGFDFTFISIHLKAYPNKKNQEKRKQQIKALVKFIDDNKAKMDEDIVLAGDWNIYEEGTDDHLVNSGYVEAEVNTEKTSIHKGKLGKRFDRFYVKLGEDLERTKQKFEVGSILDAHSEDAEGNYQDYETNKQMSDHFLVKMKLDVSEDKDY